MSQFESASPYAQPDESPAFGPTKTSGLSITALVCSLVFCCPCTTVLGVLLGAIAIPVIGKNPALRGKGIAIAAILIGLVATGGQFVGGKWWYDTFSKPVQVGPLEELTAAFAGDYAGFRSGMMGDAANVTDEEIQAFVDQLRARYGEFSTCYMDENEFATNPPTMEELTQPIKPMPYVLEFDSGRSVKASIWFGPIDEAGNWLGGIHWDDIVIIDPQNGDITFPAAAPESGG
jgi:hypothetical protein